jgi:hypothetical protein
MKVSLMLEELPGPRERSSLKGAHSIGMKAEIGDQVGYYIMI